MRSEIREYSTPASGMYELVTRYHNFDKRKILIADYKTVNLRLNCYPIDAFVPTSFKRMYTHFTCAVREFSRAAMFEQPDTILQLTTSYLSIIDFSNHDFCE
jgi:hypothetical protein